MKGLTIVRFTMAVVVVVDAVVVDVDDDDCPRNTNLIFETHNCATATPATISR